MIGDQLLLASVHELPRRRVLGNSGPLGFLGASLFRGLFENSRYGSCALALGRSKVGVTGWQDYYPPPKSPALFRRGFLGPGSFPDL